MNEDIIDVSDKGINTISSEGVTPGIPMSGFHWVNRSTGKDVMGRMMALGKRNMEFRRAEAEKSGYDFLECPGSECPHK